jgi:hypothetical protein
MLDRLVLTVRPDVLHELDELRVRQAREAGGEGMHLVAVLGVSATVLRARRV